MASVKFEVRAAIPDSINLQADLASDGVDLYTIDTARRLWRIDGDGVFSPVGSVGGPFFLALCFDGVRLVTFDGVARKVYAVDRDTAALAELFDLDGTVAFPRAATWRTALATISAPAWVPTWSPAKATVCSGQTSTISLAGRSKRMSWPACAPRKASSLATTEATQIYNCGSGAFTPAPT